MSEQQPNILYIHSHDTGRFVQPYGYQVPTPNIQMLADQGVFFRQAFCAAPTCSGSRASLLTGQYCHSNGMFGLAHRGWALTDYSRHIVHPLREAGYTSVMLGEQHVSKDASVIGFDRVVDVDSNHTADVAPAANAILRDLPEPFFLSVGFFETHRDFHEPTSVRDSLYSMPPPNLPDTPATREDMAAFKSSARTLDQGIGMVMNELYRLGLAERTLILCTTDHGLAFPRAKATLFDRGTGVMLLMRGPGGFTGGKVVDSMVSHLDLYPPLCTLAGAGVPDWVQGTSLLPLVRGETDAVRAELFTEMTYHAAYEPLRAIRTERWKYVRRFHDYPHPVLANCDDSKTKTIMVDAGWGQHLVPEEQLYDLIHDPNEHRDLSWDPKHKGTLAHFRHRLADWMEETDDPLRFGPIEAPPGAIVNAQTAISPAEEPRGIDPLEQTGAKRGHP